MSRRDREDEPGSFQHVYNRGVARRPLFESRDEVRFFLARVARVFRQGLLEVHAFSFLITHFHMLVRSPVGDLSRAMCLVQNIFARWFNRRHRRDGPLFRGRFRSKCVKSEAYARTLIRYIDQNPVKARAVTDPALYPYGSATHYLNGPGPRWLTRTSIEALVRADSGLLSYDPEAYRRSFGTSITEGERELIQRRLRGRFSGEDPLDDLLGAAPEAVRELLARRSQRADGPQPGWPVAAPATLDAAIEVLRADDRDWTVKPKREKRDAWRLMRMGLFRDTAGLTYQEIAIRTGCSQPSAVGLVRVHHGLLRTDALYGSRASAVVEAALGVDHAALLRLGTSPRVAGDWSPLASF